MIAKQQAASEDFEDIVLVTKEELQEESPNLPSPKKGMISRVAFLFKNPFKR